MRTETTTFTGPFAKSIQKYLEEKPMISKKLNDKKYKISRCVSHKGKFNDEKMYILFTLEDAKVLGFISIRSDATSIKPIGKIQEFPKEIIGNMSTFDFIMDYIDKDEVWNNIK